MRRSQATIQAAMLTFPLKCSLSCVNITFLRRTNSETHPGQHCPDPHCQHGGSERISGWLEDENKMLQLQHISVSGRFTTSQSCTLCPQSSSVVHHNHSIVEQVVNLRKTWMPIHTRLVQTVDPEKQTSTTRKRVCIRPPESSLASNWTVPLFLT